MSELLKFGGILLSMLDASNYFIRTNYDEINKVSETDITVFGSSKIGSRTEVHNQMVEIVNRHRLFNKKLKEIKILNRLAK